MKITNEIIEKFNLAIQKKFQTQLIQILVERLDDMNDKVSILEIDTDQSPEVAEVYDVYQLPTMLIFKDNNNNIIHEHEGVMLSEDIQKIIEAQQ